MSRGRKEIQNEREATVKEANQIIEKIKLGESGDQVAARVEEYIGYATDIHFFVTIEKDLRTKSDREKARIRFESAELKEFSGIMKNLFTSLKITDFGVQLHVNDSDPLNDFVFWTVLHFDYHFKSGGSNGSGFMDVKYDSKEGRFLFTERAH